MIVSGKTALLAFCALMVCRTISLCAEYKVSKSGGGDYATVGAALTAAAPGDTVRIVDSGVYEENLLIDLPVSFYTEKIKVVKEVIILHYGIKMVFYTFIMDIFWKEVTISVIEF